MTDLTRRQLLIAGTALGIPGCSLFRQRPIAYCPNDPALSDDATPLTIDVHAHVFNATDLQVQRFITLVALKQEDSLGDAASDLAGVLQNIGWETAPSASEELEMLKGLRPALDKCETGARNRRLEEMRERSYSRARGSLDAALRRTGRTGKERNISRATAQSDFLIRNLPEKRQDYLKQRAARLQSREKTVQGAIDFVIQNFQYRYVSVHDYLETFSRGPTRRIDLLVAHLVDYDWWLAKGAPSHTSLGDQVRVMEQIALLTGGRVHAFAPFDPLREVVASLQGGASSLALVQDAVRNRGCIGVKLYPPMGFAAWGNTGATLWNNRDWLPDVVKRPDFGKRLDDAMAALFAWSRDEQVPIMAHANASNAPAADFAELATARHWKKALDQHDKDPQKKLRINFGHFGHGAKGHSEAFIDLMGAPGAPGAKAYADASYCSDVLENAALLTAAYHALYLRRDAILARRLMYGSDWEMSLVERNVDKYLSGFETVYANLQRELSKQGSRWNSLVDDFFGRNAVDYLGLKKGEMARQRLDAFYKGRYDGTPGWMKKVDALT